MKTKEQFCGTNQPIGIYEIRQKLNNYKPETRIFTHYKKSPMYEERRAGCKETLIKGSEQINGWCNECAIIFK